ncbi:IucA/IucC family protein [Streptomyces sp. H27-D2]|uniref:IucA/IucC family protein n=1 Tax=Streptomyces sp. H27-D2 TaxID=3046304 RepID=UPI002DBB3472|nr:IucA/IucC family siderophore biosynthesis protein [Streptomyces sp. H27-D2]MEC4014911.1 IucA/IucC family siderophore biosynthesis protein [Streptomyces sp. H27-D2]
MSISTNGMNGTTGTNGTAGSTGTTSTKATVRSAAPRTAPVGRATPPAAFPLHAPAPAASGSVRTASPGDVVAHLTPERWARANRLLVRKALAEFAHERLFTPEKLPSGGYAVTSDDKSVEYRFSARVLALDHWQIDVDSITRHRDGVEVALDALDLIIELRRTLCMGERNLPLYLEEISSTLAGAAYKLAQPPVSAAELSRSGFQAIETGMTEGHPCFVANNGRIGFDAAEYHAYAPEAGAPVQLIWLAARRDRATFSASADLDYDRLIDSELGPDTLGRFSATLAELGLRLDDFLLIPVHPWQWWNKLSVTFAAEVAQRNLVCLGQGDDAYLAQQSIRTFFNTSDPSKHYVKTALSVLNMGFMRGLSAEYMKATPAINDWVAGLVGTDEVLKKSGLGIIRECAAVGYHHQQYEAATTKDSPYRKMLAALWRESPVPMLEPGQRLATMASLLHTDRDGGSFAAALIAESGLAPEVWLRRYLDVYLTPLLHCFYAYDLVFMPHGENVILVIEDGVPLRAVFKDIAEEIAVMDPEAVLPPAVERIRVAVPEELKTLSIFTDVFDCFFRFLNGILSGDGGPGEDGAGTGGEAGAGAGRVVLSEETFWATVAACVADYQASAPQLADRFEQYDLFTERFSLSCLNRLQLRNNEQMIDLQDPAGALQFVGTLENPIARFARRG